MCVLSSAFQRARARLGTTILTKVVFCLAPCACESSTSCGVAQKWLIGSKNACIKTYKIMLLIQRRHSHQNRFCQFGETLFFLERVTAEQHSAGMLDSYKSATKNETSLRCICARYPMCFVTDFAWFRTATFENKAQTPPGAMRVCFLACSLCRHITP